MTKYDAGANRDQLSHIGYVSSPIFGNRRVANNLELSVSVALADTVGSNVYNLKQSGRIDPQ